MKTAQELTQEALALRTIEERRDWALSLTNEERYVFMDEIVRPLTQTAQCFIEVVYEQAKAVTTTLMPIFAKIAAELEEVQEEI